jgi:uncharacterized GH25 family protein
MKHNTLLTLFVLLLSALAARAQDNYLVAEKFAVNKGEKLNIHLLYGDQFKNDGELRYDGTLTSKFMLYSGGKKIDVIKASKDSAAPVLSYPVPGQGIAMVDMVRQIPPTAIDRDVYATFLSNEGMTKLAETVNNSNQSRFTEKKTCFMKTLVKVDKNSGGDFDKPTGDDYEIVLKNSPYKLNYGEDISAILYIKGKPAPASVPVDVYIKARSGSIYPQKLQTNAKGEFSITASREGIYLIRCSQTTTSSGSDADFESIQAAVTFVFTSENDSPNSYDEPMEKIK